MYPRWQATSAVYADVRAYSNPDVVAFNAGLEGSSDLVYRYPPASHCSVDQCIDEMVAYQQRVAAARGLATSVGFIFAPFLALPASVCFVRTNALNNLTCTFRELENAC